MGSDRQRPALEADAVSNQLEATRARRRSDSPQPPLAEVETRPRRRSADEGAA